MIPAFKIFGRLSGCLSNFLRRLWIRIIGKTSWTAWSVNQSLVHKVSQIIFGKKNLDAVFCSMHIKMGALSPAVSDALRQSLLNSPARQMKVGDFYPSYGSNAAVKDLEDGFARNFVFFNFGSTSSALLHSILQDLDLTIQKCLGSPWHVLNVRCWLTKPHSSDFASNAWHSDGFPPGIHKILIYLSPAGPGTGTTEVRLSDNSTISMEGPAGSWIFFNTSEYMHRGIAPQIGERVLLEVTIAPALVGNVRPVFAGLNATYPRFPWGKRPLFDSPG